MNTREYQAAARETANPDQSRIQSLINSALGLSGESGEFANMIKKAEFHGRELDIPALVLELGDILWYVSQACDALNTSMATVMQLNIEKLRKRWPDGFKPGTTEAGGDSAIKGRDGASGEDSGPVAWVPLPKKPDPTLGEWIPIERYDPLIHPTIVDTWLEYFNKAPRRWPNCYRSPEGFWRSVYKPRLLEDPSRRITHFMIPPAGPNQDPEKNDPNEETDWPDTNDPD